MLLTRTVLAALIACALPLVPATANDVTGAGATFPAPLYARWAFEYRAASGNSVNYQSIGSGAGQAQIKARTVDFGASDDPMSPADLQANGLVQFPTVIGAVVPIVNLPGIADGQLRLTQTILADIYQGKITRWNDPQIAAINKGLTLRGLPITPVYRSDSSGTTAIFSGYMQRTARNWKLGAGKSISWPTGSGGKGNEGVSSNVKNTAGAVGYVESNFAFANRLTMAQLNNAAGRWVRATPASFNAAASQADWKNARSGVVNMMALPGAGTWPIVSATYALVEAKPRQAQRTTGALAFFSWSWANGGPTAQQLGFVPLPPAGVQAARNEWGKITGVTLPR